MIVFVSCGDTAEANKDMPVVIIDSAVKDTISIKADKYDTTKPIKIELQTPTDSMPEALVNFAETLIGIPYKYASTNPVEGFDCSGFITYVFNHFKITVPRSSVDFTNVGTEVSTTDAKRGDLILFTGTDSTIRIVGHMGIITENMDGEIKFIHSTSGKANSVTISALNDYYKGRFVKIIRVFKENNQ